MGAVYHFSEDATIRRFAPHVAPSNPSHPPAVWAIDATHAPVFWFPPECPRASVWAHTAQQQERMCEIFGTEAARICATESGWFERMRAAQIFRYTFDADEFVASADGDGQYISDHVVEPVAVDALDDLLTLHVGAGVELRFTPRLGALTDQILASGLPFSLLRLRNALV